MIREIIRPQHTNITIEIPTSYINKEIEFILFPLDEIPKTTFKNNSLKGIFNNYEDSSKILLEDNAWKNHITDKFKNND
jgi:hypothetical protein